MVSDHKTWRQTFAVPEQGNALAKVKCPTCGALFELKVFSEHGARFRKLGFAWWFFVISAVGIVSGVSLGAKKGLFAVTISAPFLVLGVRHLVDALRGQFYPSDLVCHTKGKVHRIFDDHKIMFHK